MSKIQSHETVIPFTSTHTTFGLSDDHVIQLTYKGIARVNIEEGGEDWEVILPEALPCSMMHTSVIVGAQQDGGTISVYFERLSLEVKDAIKKQVNKKVQAYLEHFKYLPF